MFEKTKKNEKEAAVGQFLFIIRPATAVISIQLVEQSLPKTEIRSLKYWHLSASNNGILLTVFYQLYLSIVIAELFIEEEEGFLD